MAVLLTLAFCVASAWAEAETEILDVLNIFLYEMAIEDDQNSEESLSANAAYRERLASLVERLDGAYETAKQALAVDDFTALTWQVTNRTDQALFVNGSDFEVDFEGIEYGPVRRTQSVQVSVGTW